MHTLPSNPPARTSSSRTSSSRTASRGRHAAKREPLAPAARAGLAGGLAIALLPLGAGAAAADEVVAAAEPATGTATTSPEASPAASPAPAADARRATTVVRFSAPAGDSDGRVPVAVRLLADGAGVEDGLVRLERRTPSGWHYAGRLLTDASGHGAGTLRIPSTSDLRATYIGASTRTPATSAARTVTVPLVAAEGAGSAVAQAAAGAGAVLSVAAAQVGKPYRFGAVGPTAFDCSGFTRYVYSRIGKALPHNSHAQERATVRVSKSQARPGDLVFIKDVSGHVGIYAGGGKMYDAPRAGKDVTLRTIWTANYTVGRVR